MVMAAKLKRRPPFDHGGATPNVYHPLERRFAVTCVCCHVALAPVSELRDSVLEDQPGLSGGIRQRSHSPMILAWTAVKTHFLNPGLKRLSRRSPCRRSAAAALLPPAVTRSRMSLSRVLTETSVLPANVVDHLAANLPETAMHAKPRPFGDAANSVAHIKAPPLPPPIYDHLLLHGSTQASEMLAKAALS